MSIKKIKSALISVYNKDNLATIIQELHKQSVILYSTGGTEKFIKELGIPVVAVESLTNYPSIFGGRVKTLHPKVFGGILYRRDDANDLAEAAKFDIPSLDLVIVDLYPFEETVAASINEIEIIEKIDIGGISLIRAAAKNFNDTTIISSRNQYEDFYNLLVDKKGFTELSDRKKLAALAFNVSSHYDTAIFNYFNREQGLTVFKESIQNVKPLRYGENPHQKSNFYGDLDALFDVLNGKELSYNNLVDVDACVALIDEFEEELINEQKTTFAIIKHTNACGIASAKTVKEAYVKALACDPISAFGGVIITNNKVDLDTAKELNQLFCEVLIAPDFDIDALVVLKERKNRIILKRKPVDFANKQFKTLLNGVIEQDKDLRVDKKEDLKVVTLKNPSNVEEKALIFACKVAKHTKSNTIVLAKQDTLISSGVGQTSRVDALKQAIEKANVLNFDLKGAVMASDAFFPFPDCVEIAHKAGITAILQPGGSVKDKDSIQYCNNNNLSMVFTGIRHFKH
jgi:phosphoribosylaminoimidazolecarboxamide formyltransferase / IMP cyclohydrolase